MYPYGGGASAVASATLLLPTSGWGTRYLAVNAFRPSAFGSSFTLDVVALEDDTAVTLVPSTTMWGGPGVPPAHQGVPTTYALKKGQVLQFAEFKELTGSRLDANRPIGVWGGASCMNIDIDQLACDAAQQQLPPTSALGREYVGVRYRNRFDGVEGAPPWRLVGAVDGTILSYLPEVPDGAPATLDRGQLVQLRSPGPFVVRSQGDDHPFYLSAHMTGCQEVFPADFECRGEPEFVNVLPVAQT
jgi:hypothetical protein